MIGVCVLSTFLVATQNPLVAPEKVTEAFDRTRHIGLHRVTATLDATFDLYRLALIELVPSIERIAETGETPTATPSTPLPAPTVEVLKRLTNSLTHRIPFDALPAIQRGYQAEAEDAFEQLSVAQTLGDVAGPLRILQRAILGLLRSADDILDLYNRERPLQMRLVDGSFVLDEISEAIDEVARAENHITRTREKKRDFSEQLDAFLRLEVNLGHALDLIAAAKDAGIYIGFEPRLATNNFAALTQTVKQQIALFDALIKRLEKNPANLAGPPHALITRNADGLRIAKISWQLDATAPTAVRIYTKPNLTGLKEALTNGYVCEGSDEKNAQQKAAADLEDREASYVLAAQVPGGRLGHEWLLKDEPLAPPIYRIAPVNAFGAEGIAYEVTAETLPDELTGPRWVRAQSLKPDLSSPQFYYDHDAIEIRWGPSPNDLTKSVELQKEAAEKKQSHVRRYHIIRNVADQQSTVGWVPAGTNKFVDRPSVDALKKGVRYTVLAESTDGRAIPPPAKCLNSAIISLDLNNELQHARRGQRRLPITAEQIATSGEELKEVWWKSRPVDQRLTWLEMWPELFDKNELPQWIAEIPTHLRKQDLTWIQLEVWLTQQEPVVRDEIERFWNLLSVEAKKRTLQQWRASLGKKYGVWVDQQLDAGTADVTRQVLRPAIVDVWWQSRHPREREELTQFWQSLTSEQREQSIRKFLSGLPSATLVALRWPDWQQLDDDERYDRLHNSFRFLPQKFEPFVKRYAEEQHRLHDTAGAPQTLSAKVSTLLSQTRYFLRPIDKTFAFRLPALFTLSLLLTLLTITLGKAKKRTTFYTRPIAAISAIEDAVGRATELGRPILYVPGIDDLNNIQTVASLLILRRVAELAARHNCELIVANIYPMVQTVARDVVAQGYSASHHGDRFHPDNIRYVAAEQFPFAAGVGGIMLREKPAANMFLGCFFAESLILTEIGFSAGALQIAGTAEISQLPFLIPSCEHTLIGEELFAASAYLSADVSLLSALRAMDWFKIVVVAALLVGSICETFGVFNFVDFFMSR